jgi:hypothetical protein
VAIEQLATRATSLMVGVVLIFIVFPIDETVSPSILPLLRPIFNEKTLFLEVNLIAIAGTCRFHGLEKVTFAGN